MLDLIPGAALPLALPSIAPVRVVARWAKTLRLRSWLPDL